MAAQVPFQACSGTTTGKTVKVTANATPSSVSGSLDCTNLVANSVLVTNAGSVLVFVRMSNEATPTATAADIPMLGNSSRMFTNPVPFGTLGLAVISSTTTAADVYFTPGAGN